MYKLFAAGIGSLITIMIMINSVFAAKLGNILSILIIHLVGLFVSSGLVLMLKNPKPKKPVPLYLYTSGIIGVFLLFSNNFCFQILGASLTLALGILGQSLGAIFIDTTGFLGMEKHPFYYKKLIGISIMIAGVFLMIEHLQMNVLFIPLAIITGISVILAMVINTRLAAYVGLFKGTQFNFATGTITIAVIVLGWQSNITEGLFGLAEIKPIYIFGGGVLGVLVVASINFVLPNISTFSGSILLFLGQITTGLIIDYCFSDLFSVPKLIGGTMVFSGLVIDHLINNKTAKSVKQSDDIIDVNKKSFEFNQ
jgi:bacterial/archaeal transporter family-2 protein